MTATPPDAPKRRPPERLADALRAAIRDPLLWPVLIVMALVAATLVAGLLLLALKLHRLPALAGVALLVFASGDLVLREWRRRGFGPTGLVLAVLWLLSATLAGVAHLLGLF